MTYSAAVIYSAVSSSRMVIFDPEVGFGVLKELIWGSFLGRYLERELFITMFS